MSRPPDDTRHTLRSIASVGLDMSTCLPPEQPLTDDEWDQILTSAVRERITGLLAYALDAGMLPATEPQHAAAHRVHAAALRTCLVLEDQLLAVSAALDRAGVDVRVLKGPAVAHLDYDDPSMRTFGDIDLLVRSEQYDDAIRVLVSTGRTRRYREPRPGFDRRFGKGVCLVAPSGLETDLHRTFVMGAYGLWLDLEAVWSSSETFVIGGRQLQALGPEGRFLHACYHTALGDAMPRLAQLRDVAQLLHRPQRAVDIRAALDLARAWRGEAVLARAVRLTWDAHGLRDHWLSEWANGYRPRPLEARALRTYLDPDMGYAARSLVAARAVRGWRAKAAFTWALAFPDRSYGAGRHAGRWRRWRSALGQLRRLHRRNAR